MKKTDVKNIAGGTKTTVTEPNGSKTITYDGVKNLHIGRTFRIGTPRGPASTGKHQSSTSNFSSTVKKGVTFKKVESLHLDSNDINNMHSSKDHKTYENEKDFHSSQSTSSFKP